MSHFNQHWVKEIHAHRHDYKDAPLNLVLKTGYSEMPTEITLFFDDDALVEALVKAVNDTIAAHKERGETQEAA